MITAIGSVRTDDLLAEAARWSEESPRHGVCPSAATPPPWTLERLQAAAEDRARADGGFVVASGGTNGRPKLTVLAPDLGVGRVLANWRPLRPGDRLLNLFSTGRMWGAHYFYNAVAVHSRSTVAPMGALSPEEFTEWADTVVGMGVTALAGAPNVLARFAETVRGAGVTLPIRSVIWSGEPMTRARAEAIRSAFPEAGLWGNYGSIETFVVGVSRPKCRLGALHLLPGQLLEPQEEGALLTRTGDGWPVPAWRFRLGDRIRPAECPCGEGDAFEVTGRADDRFKLYGGMVRIGEVLDCALLVKGVHEAQLILHADPYVPSAVVGMCLRYTGPLHDAAQVREALLRGIEDLEVCDRHTPEAVAVEHVADMERNPRTNKVLPVVRRTAENLTDVTGGPR